MKTLVERITPAHAGKSLIEFNCVFTEWDHPRTRGEKGTGEGLAT